MTIPIAQADRYLKELIAEEYDADIDAAFPQELRRRTLQEAVAAIARLRPDLFVSVVDLAYNAAIDGYELPDNYEYIREVIGIRMDGKIHSLRGSTEADRITGGACWRTDQTTEITPKFYVWSPENPRLVYIDGYKPTGTIVVNATDLTGLVVDGSATDLPLPYTYIVEVTDWALSRLYSIEDTGMGDSGFHLTRFRQMLSDRMTTDASRNPLAMSAARSKMNK